MIKFTAPQMKRDLAFPVTVNGRLVAAFMHHNDAMVFVEAARASRPDLQYQIGAN